MSLASAAQSPTSKTSPGKVGWADVMVTGLVLLTTFALCVFPLMDTDFWWHLRTGQLIWERGEVPRTDWFLFSDADQRWINLQWGYELGLTALYGLGGVNLVILVRATIVTLLVGIGWFSYGANLPAWQRAGLWLPAIICITGRANERPELLSQLFLTCWLWIASRVETRPKWIWALPVLQVIWINCHALFILGLVVGGAYAVDYALRWLANGRFGLEPVPPVLRPVTVAGAGAACALAAFVNPYGWQGATFPLVLYRKFSSEQEFYSAHIGEFQQPVQYFFRLRYGFESVYLDAEMLLFLLTAGSLLILLVKYRWWSPFRWLLFLGFSNLAWEAARNVNIFAIVASCVLLRNLADWRRLAREDAELSPETKGVRQAGQPATAWRAESILGPLLAGGAYSLWLLAVVTSVWGLTFGEFRLFGLGERSHWFAHEAIRFAGKPGFPNRALLEHFGLAGVYEFHHGPGKKVFMDPRLEVARMETFEQQLIILEKMRLADRSWESMLRDRDGSLPTIILDSRGSLPVINGLLLTPGWRLVFADPAAAVFLHERQAEALGIPAVDPRPVLMAPRF